MFQKHQQPPPPLLANAVLGERCFSNPVLWRVWERTRFGARSPQVGLARVLEAPSRSKSTSGLQRKPRDLRHSLSLSLAAAHTPTFTAIIKHCLAKACYLLCKYIKIQNVKKTHNRLGHNYTFPCCLSKQPAGFFSNSAAHGKLSVFFFFTARSKMYSLFKI